jgi:hypothetical protein
MVFLDNLVLLVFQDLKGNLDFLVYLARKVILDILANLVLMDFLVNLVSLEWKETLDFLVFLVLKVILDSLVNLVYLDKKEIVVPLDCRVKMVYLVYLELKENGDLMVFPDRRVIPDTLELLEQKANLDYLDPLAYLAFKVHLVFLDSLVSRVMQANLDMELLEFLEKKVFLAFLENRDDQVLPVLKV